MLELRRAGRPERMGGNYINYAYEHARTQEGFFYEDWPGKDPKRASQLLMQDAVIESYAVLALYYNSQL